MLFVQSYLFSSGFVRSCTCSEWTVVGSTGITLSKNISWSSAQCMYFNVCYMQLFYTVFSDSTGIRILCGRDHFYSASPESTFAQCLVIKKTIRSACLRKKMTKVKHFRNTCIYLFIQCSIFFSASLCSNIIPIEWEGLSCEPKLVHLGYLI